MYNYSSLYYKLLFVTGVIALLVAYYVEYFMHLLPCPLCVYQRLPYIALLYITAISLSDNNNIKYVKIIRIILVLAAVIAFYHGGVEAGVFEFNNTCSGMFYIPPHFTADTATQMLQDRPYINCKEVPLKIFSLSMSNWNFLLNCALFLGASLIERSKNPH